MAQLVWIFIGEIPQPSIMKTNLHIHEIHYLVFTYGKLASMWNMRKKSAF